MANDTTVKTPSATPSVPKTETKASDSNQTAMDSMNARKFSGIGFTLGFIGGLVYANKKGKHGVWTYIGHGIMFGAAGTAAGSVIDKVTGK